MSGRAALLELLFPPRCAVCRDATPRGSAVCPSCMRHLAAEFALETTCAVCGKPAASCVCKSEPFSFSRCISAFAYGPRVSDAVALLKQQPDSPVAGQFALLMADALRRALPGARFDAVTEVPMPPDEVARRGHNQARTLALLISGILEISHRETPLVRHQTAVAQHTLSAGQRAEHARNSYGAAPNGTVLGRVLLVDDVITTGSTLDRCAALLKGCGAGEVVCLTAATALLHEDNWLL